MDHNIQKSPRGGPNQTRGIWFFSEPLQLERDGKKYDIYLMDTEGLGKMQLGKIFDQQIFSLSILLSSFMIYNSMGPIDKTQF